MGVLKNFGFVLDVVCERADAAREFFKARISQNQHTHRKQKKQESPR